MKDSLNENPQSKTQSEEAHTRRGPAQLGFRVGAPEYVCTWSNSDDASKDLSPSWDEIHHPLSLATATIAS